MLSGYSWFSNPAGRGGSTSPTYRNVLRSTVLPRSAAVFLNASITSPSKSADLKSMERETPWTTRIVFSDIVFSFIKETPTRIGWGRLAVGASVGRVLQFLISAHVRTTPLAHVPAILCHVRIRGTSRFKRNISTPTVRATELVAVPHRQVRMIAGVRPQPVVQGRRSRNIADVVGPQLLLRLLVALHGCTGHGGIVLVCLRLHPEPLPQRIKRVRLHAQFCPCDLQRVHDLHRGRRGVTLLDQPRPEHPQVEVVILMAHRNVGLVDPLPHFVEESGVIPFGGEHGVFVAVDPTRRTYRPRPLKHVVGVDSAPDGVLEAVEVPE